VGNSEIGEEHEMVQQDGLNEQEVEALVARPGQYSDDDIGSAAPSAQSLSVASLLGAVDSPERIEESVPEKSDLECCLDLISCHLIDSSSVAAGFQELPKSQQKQLEDALNSSRVFCSAGSNIERDETDNWTGNSPPNPNIAAFALVNVLNNRSRSGSTLGMAMISRRNTSASPKFPAAPSSSRSRHSLLGVLRCPATS
jgi:hypothetical protein